MFYSSLHAAICKSTYCDINLRPKQVKCLEAIYCGKDCTAGLPTGYGKSLIFHLLPALLRGKLDNEGPSSPQVVVVIVLPLNAMTKDKLRRINKGSVRAAALNVKRKQNTGDFELDFGDANPSLLEDAKYDMLFLHPEAFLTCMDGKELLQSVPYQCSVKAIVADEAHCILEWGDDFRKDYSRLALMCAAFHSAPVLALTATASYKDVSIIKESLNLNKPLEVIASPNRANLFYEKVFREDIDFFVKTLTPIAVKLNEKKVDYPLTVFYLTFKWCGFAFKFLEKQLCCDQYYPTTSEALPENRLFAQYHAPQTQAMKDLILTELASPSSKVCYFCHCCYGNGGGCSLNTLCYSCLPTMIY